jgi:SAM-dependent methyltransferase
MTRCLSCGANGTNLSLIPVIKNHTKKNPTLTAWEMSTYGGTLNYLRRNIPEVIESEFFPGKTSGQLVNGILNQDVQNLSFKDSSIDLITSSQVFEHVSNDRLGYFECYRVLRKNGALIFSVPLYDIPKTRMLAELVDGRLQFYCEPEYHDSRAGGPESALTFWHHSIHDISDRVAQAGFDVRLIEITIASSQKAPAKVIYAIKK